MYNIYNYAKGSSWIVARSSYSHDQSNSNLGTTYYLAVPLRQVRLYPRAAQRVQEGDVGPAKKGPGSARVRVRKL